MTIEKFVPELWEAAVQEPFEKNLVYAQPNVVNTKYEGTIREQGDTVHVSSVGAPTVNKYDKTQDIDIEDLDTDSTALVIDQGDYFAFRVNDVDRVQTAGNFESPATKQAGIGMRDTVDKYVAGLFEPGAKASNKLGRTTIVDGEPHQVTVGQTYAYHVLVKLRERLDGQSVPTEGRFVIVDPAFVSCLLLDKRYTDLSASGTDVPLWQGQVGRATGFNVLVSNNVPKVGGTGAAKDDLVIAAGIPDALSFANQINSVEAMRQEKRFADQIRGLNIYGAKVFRPEAIATATVQYAPVVLQAPAGG